VKFGITGNISNDKKHAAVLSVLRQLDEKRVSYVTEGRFARMLHLPDTGIPVEKLGSTVDMVIVFGGDGTLLYSAKNIGLFGIPVLGVNTGHLGFLTEIPLEELPRRMPDLLDGNYTVEKRMMIEAVVPGAETRTFFAVNDIVIDKGGHPRLMDITLFIEKEFCHTYSSDGMIVSTATGSTAYSLSAGGPLVYPTLDDILVTPICPHTLSARPMIIPGNFHIDLEIVAGPADVQIHADGRPGAHLKIGDTIAIHKSTHTLNLAHFPEHNFFRMLRTKLGWGSRNSFPR